MLLEDEEREGVWNNEEFAGQHRACRFAGRIEHGDDSGGRRMADIHFFNAGTEQAPVVYVMGNRFSVINLIFS